MLLVLAIAFGGILIACEKDDDTDKTNEEIKITDGRWITAHHEYNEIDGKPDTVGAVLKLKEDNTYYYYSAWTYSIGTWKIEEGTFDYYKINQGEVADSEDEDQTKYTGTQQLVLTAYDGKTFEGVYAEGKIWNMARDTRQGISHDTLTQEPDYEWTGDEETDIVVLDLKLPKDGSHSLQLYASMTDNGNLYDGIVSPAVANATYEKSTADGKTTYVLKNNGTKYAELTEQNGVYTYTPEGEEGFIVVSEAWTPTYSLSADAKATFVGESSQADVFVELKLWEDGSADFAVTNYDTAEEFSVMENGTWKKNGDQSIDVTFGTTLFSVSAPDGEGNISAALNVPAGELFAEAWAVTVTGKASQVVYTFEGNADVYGITGMGESAVPAAFVLELSSDMTAVFTVSISMGGMSAEGVVDTGTYTADLSGAIPVIEVAFEKGGKLTASPDYSTATATGIALDLTYVGENVSVSLDVSGNVMPMTLTFEAKVRYNYSTLAEVLSFTAEGISTEGTPLPSSPITADYTLVLTNDGKAELKAVLHVMDGFNVECVIDSGTWTSDDGQIPTYTVVLEQGGTLTSSPDYAGATSTSVPLTISYTAEGSEVYVASLGASVTLTFTATLTAVYSIA